MNIPLYLLGSGIFRNPVYCWMSAMVVSGILLLALTCLMIWLSFSESATFLRSRDAKIIMCFFAVLASFGLSGFCWDGYHQALDDQDGNTITDIFWYYQQDSLGNILVYDIPFNACRHIHKKNVISEKTIVTSEETAVNMEETQDNTIITRANPTIFRRNVSSHRFIPCLGIDND